MQCMRNTNSNMFVFTTTTTTTKSAHPVDLHNGIVDLQSPVIVCSAALHNTRHVHAGTKAPIGNAPGAAQRW